MKTCVWYAQTLSNIFFIDLVVFGGAMWCFMFLLGLHGASSVFFFFFPHVVSRGSPLFFQVKASGCSGNQNNVKTV